MSANICRLGRRRDHRSAAGRLDGPAPVAAAVEVPRIGLSVQPSFKSCIRSRWLTIAAVIDAAKAQ